ncbi:DDE-type integrase/transposase/recombinase [Nitrosomonas oligotropha]|uniref:DDE-type integrase/transposase/recombinase n=1 Tax=Nitrosomonas oligotropha TaxID=42354 RepID=UPI000B7DA64D|nr:DDE-type integrase/transposase/recombinase [Nitrosomonas oligotropha]
MEFKGTDGHAFGKACRQHRIGQKFTRIKRPQTNSKVERVIRTLMGMWHSQLALKIAPIGAFCFPVSLTSTIP